MSSKLACQRSCWVEECKRMCVLVDSLRRQDTTSSSSVSMTSSLTSGNVAGAQEAADHTLCTECSSSDLSVRRNFSNDVVELSAAWHEGYRL
jgi:hypothetical protein